MAGKLMEHMVTQFRRGKLRKKGKAAKVEKTLHEFKVGNLHSGSKTGPIVKERKQAVAIALNQAKRKGY